MLSFSGACVCWLAKVVLLVHCSLQVSCIQGTLQYPVSCRTLQLFVISVIDEADEVPQDETKALCMDCSRKEQAGHCDQQDVLGFGQEIGQCARHLDYVG